MPKKQGHAIQIHLTPIGVVRSTRKYPEDDHWDSIQCLLELQQPIWMTELMKEYWS